MIVFNYENEVDARVNVCPTKLFVVLLEVSDTLRSQKRGLGLQINFRSLRYFRAVRNPISLKSSLPK